MIATHPITPDTSVNSVTLGSESRGMLKDAAFKRTLQELRKTDNSTNWWHIARVYAIILVAITGAVSVHQFTLADGAHAAWNLPAFLLAIAVIGASMHQLAGANHEATHYLLFRNRTLNDVASDWLCMFPLFSSTNVFRQHHLAHHQYINDPERDPDFAQLRAAGQWLRFPVGKRSFLLSLLKQATLVPLVRYVLVRARFNTFAGGFHNPYADPTKAVSRWPNALMLGFTAMSFVVQMAIAFTGPLWAAFVVPGVVAPLVVVALLGIPRERYSASRLIPPVSPRAVVIGQVAYYALLHLALTVAQQLTGTPVWVYCVLLWIVPLLTTFPLFMVLRQLVQHGNGDRGWLTNTRTFLVNPIIRYAVFPFGMDYHLPHHMFCTVPHYRLPQLHAVLLRDPEYAADGIVVEGYFFPPNPGPARNPTVLEVLGPAYHRNGADVFIDADAAALPTPTPPQLND